MITKRYLLQIPSLADLKNELEPGITLVAPSFAQFMDVTFDEKIVDERGYSKMSDANTENKKDEMPDNVMLAREDVLSIHILYEREMRLNAEIQSLRNEQLLNKIQMSQKYGIDFNNYTIDTSNNTARRIK